MLVEIISCHIGSFLGYFVLLYGLLGVSVGILHPLLTFLHLFVVIYEPSLYCRFVTRSVKFCGWSPEACLPTEPQSCWEIHPLCSLPLSGSISVWMPTGNARATFPLTEHTHTPPTLLHSLTPSPDTCLFSIIWCQVIQRGQGEGKWASKLLYSTLFVKSRQSSHQLFLLQVHDSLKMGENVGPIVN